MNPDRKWKLSLYSLISALGGFLFGYDSAVISGTIQLVEEQFLLSPAMLGWFVSCALVGSILGVVMAGSLADRIGRKKVLFFSAILFALSALGCTISPNFPVLVIYRILGGIAIGIASITSPLYISEIAPAKIRGRLVAIYQLAITLGILVSYFANSYILNQSDQFDSGSAYFMKVLGNECWRGMFGAELFPAGIFLLLLFIVPESPRWLVSSGRIDRARRIMAGVMAPKETEQELGRIKQSSSVEERSFSTLFSPKLRAALLVGIVLAMAQQFSGINAVIYFGPRILTEAGLTISQSLGGQVTVGFVNMIATLVAILLVDKWGRRPLLRLGILSVCISLFVLGILFILDVSPAIVLIFILVHIASFAASLGPVTWIVISEIFPNYIRGRAIGLATLVLWVSNAIVGQLFPVLLQGIGMAGTFWSFALVTLVAFFFAIRIIPETRGKTLEEIERFWEEKRAG